MENGNVRRKNAPAPGTSVERADSSLGPRSSHAGAANQLCDFVERIGDGLVGLDKNWRCTYINRHAAELLGRHPKELIGADFWTRFPEGPGRSCQNACEKALAEQVFIRIESDYPPSNRWFEIRIYPSADGLSIIFHEISQHRQDVSQSAALLRSQNEVLERIARGVSLPETLDFLLRAIEAQCQGMLCSILLLDSDGVHMRHCAAPSLPESFIRAIDGKAIGPHAGSCGTAAFLREAVIVEDIERDPLWADYRDLALRNQLRACWSTPIFDAEHSVLGTFALYFHTQTHPSALHRELIELATHSAAIAIVKHRETEALRASEERLRLAVTGGNVGIWEWRVGTDRLLWSDELYKMFGWPAGDHLTLRKFMKAVHIQDRRSTAVALQCSLARRADFGVEYRILQPDGSLRWVDAKGRAEFDRNGRAWRMMGVALDITERKRSEEEINRREAQLAEAQRTAQLGSYEWDVRNNKVYRSEELCRLFGVSSSDFEPTFEGYLARIHPDDRNTTRETIELAFRDRRPFNLEERIIRPDGAVRVLHSQGRWILNQNQEVVKLAGICQDITERKQAEDELRRSEERFQIVARATNDAIWDWSLETDSVWWNQGITTLFGYGAGEVDKHIAWRYQKIHAEDLDRVIGGLQAAMASGEQVWLGEYRFRRGDGSYADVFDRGFVVYDRAAKPVRMIGAMTDISERKRALEILEQRVAARTAELQAKNEELKGFAYTVSHDLKAPLRGIAGYAHELDNRHSSGLDERARFCLKQILTATHNLDRLIEDLLHYARLDAETPAVTDINVGQIIESILDDRKAVILEQGTLITVNLPAIHARAWARGLVQVLTNLIDNALKYSRMAEPPRIEISTEKRDRMFRIIVGDNGIGFDMKYHDRIFGLFNRLVRQEEFEGTGAGLAIARKVTEKMGGKIWAQSKPGSGATFFLEWPEPEIGACQ
jgi:PAS domain S-box-containing protein